MSIKHGYHERLKYMRMIEDGYTLGYIHRKYGIDYELLRLLWSRYQAEGSQALVPKEGRGEVSRRVEIMQDYYKNHLTLREVLSKYDVSKTSIWKWRHIVETEGWEELRQLGSTEHYRRGKMRKPKQDPPQTEEDRLREELVKERTKNAKLEKDLERARAENALLKKVKALVEEREAIQGLRRGHDLRLLLDIKGIARSTFYYNIRPKSDRDTALRERISEIYDENRGRYGYRRVTMSLNAEGMTVNHKKVQRLMSEMGLRAKKQKVHYSSYKGEVGRVAPNIINRDFHAASPNRKWATDVSMFAIGGRRIYLSPIMDMFNGEIVSYTISFSPGMKMVLSMLHKASSRLGDLTGLILHSDQGWQYQTPRYQKALKDRGIVQSMSRKGNCLDNAMMESFFGRMKCELLYMKKNWDNADDFVSEMRRYLRYYNRNRIKLRLTGKSPVQYRTSLQPETKQLK